MDSLGISNKAIVDYVENVKQRDASSGSTREKKRLVCIGTGNNQHLECWDDNWKLPFKRIIALLRGGSSLDFAKVTEFYVQKGLKNTDFEKTITRYFTAAEHQASLAQLTPTTQSKVESFAKSALKSAPSPAKPATTSPISLSALATTSQVTPETSPEVQAAPQAQIAPQARVERSEFATKPFREVGEKMRKQVEGLMPGSARDPSFKDTTHCYCQGDTLVGIMILKPSSREAFPELQDTIGNKKQFCLSSLFILPEYQNQGHGRKFYEKICENVLASGDASLVIVDQTEMGIGDKLYAGKNIREKYDVSFQLTGGSGNFYVLQKKSKEATDVEYVKIEMKGWIPYQAIENTAAIKHLINYLKKYPEDKKFCDAEVIKHGFSCIESKILTDEQKKMYEQDLRELATLVGISTPGIQSVSQTPAAAKAEPTAQTQKQSAAHLAKKLDLALPVPNAIKARFEKVHSGQIEEIPLAGGQDLSKMADPRKKCFLKVAVDDPNVVPPVTIRSSFIPDALTRHLVEDKADLAIGQKSQDIDWPKRPITNVEAIYAQLQVQLIAAHATGDIIFHGNYSRFEKNFGRPVIVSTNIHPDYEKSGAGKVMALLTTVADQPKKKLSPEQLRFDSDQGLLDALVYHHSAQGLPSRSEINEDKGQKYTVVNLAQAKQLLEELIRSPGAAGGEKLQNKFVKLSNGEIHSLEILFNHYVHQLRNELTGLESTLPQGYVYTIDPPSIFATCFDGALMTRLQILAFKQIEAAAELKNLKKIGFNAFGNPGAVELLQAVFGERAVAKQPGIFSNDIPPRYTIKEGWALVIHNNSDAFGNNLENETGFASLDAAVGALTTASVSIREGFPNRLAYCFPPLKQ